MKVNKQEFQIHLGERRQDPTIRNKKSCEICGKAPENRIWGMKDAYVPYRRDCRQNRTRIDPFYIQQYDLPEKYHSWAGKLVCPECLEEFFKMVNNSHMK